MKVSLGTFRQIIREVLEEANRQKLVTMYNGLGQRMKKINPSTDPGELKQIQQGIRDLAGMDMGMGERLLKFYQKQKGKADTAWDHVPDRGSAGSRPRRRTPRRAA